MPANLISKQQFRDSYYLVERHKPWQDTCGFSYLDIIRDPLARGRDDLDAKFSHIWGKIVPLPPSWFARLFLISGLCLKLLLCSSHFTHTQRHTRRQSEACLPRKYLLRSTSGSSASSVCLSGHISSTRRTLSSLHLSHDSVLEDERAGWVGRCTGRRKKI